MTKPAMPAKFNGWDKSPTISNWLFSIRLYLRVTRTDEEDHVVVATTFFTGTALDWWIGMERSLGESIYQWSWQEFETRCIRRFQSVNDSQSAYQQLLRWQQTGTLTSYLAGFQSMVQQIPLQLLSEKGRLFHLVEGLNTELQTAVKLMQPTTVEEAITIAQRMGDISQDRMSRESCSLERCILER
jgi:Ty3 transposon capsid-like protein